MGSESFYIRRNICKCKKNSDFIVIDMFEEDELWILKQHKVFPPPLMENSSPSSDLWPLTSHLVIVGDVNGLISRRAEHARFPNHGEFFQPHQAKNGPLGHVHHDVVKTGSSQMRQARGRGQEDGLHGQCRQRCKHCHRISKIYPLVNSIKSKK